MKKTAFKIFELVLCVGLFVGVVGYYRFSTSAEFNPIAARDFNRNIVEAKNNQKKESDNSTEGNLWKKDENSMDNESSGADNTSDYTKKNDAEETPEESNSNQQTVFSSTVNSTEEKTEDNNQPSESTTEEDKKTADTVYDIVDGKDNNTDQKPDIIIPSDDNSSSTVPAGKDDNKTPENGSVIIKPGDDNNNTDTPGGGTGDNDKPVTKPEYVPTEEIKDPELIVDDNTYKGGGNVNANPYVDGMVSEDDQQDDRYNITVNVDYSEGAFYQLIAGETYSDKYIFYCLDTVVIINGDFNHPYSFYDDTYGESGNFMIKAVSLDGGNSWIDKFPVTIPENQSVGMKIKYAYRYSNKSDWTEETMYGEMPVHESRIYVLINKVSDNNPVLTPDNILNTYDQYRNVGDTLYLNKYQFDLFNNNKWIDDDGYNTVLFPGWVEDGNKVSSYYAVAKGRHVLQPSKTLSVPDGLHIQLNGYFFVDWNYEYLQTLTSFDRTSMQSLLRRNGSSRTVYVPEYIQAIDLDQSPATTCAWMEVPDTVMYIDEDTTPLYVTNGFIVDEDNPYYTSSEEGLLLSKAETEILAIPSAKTSITIEPGVKTVHFSRSSSVKEITILANSMDEFPEMDLSKLNNATLHIQSSILNEFIKENYDVLEDSCITVTTVADEGRSYTFDNNLQIGNDNGLYHSYVTADTLALSNNISVIRSGAFSESSVNTLILPEDGKVIDFEKGSLSGSSISKVICYTQKQYDEVSSYLNGDGLTGVSTVLSATAKGDNFEYQYYVENDVYTLVKAITCPEVFDGTMIIDGNTVAFTEISAGAFKGNTTLKMVNLNEAVKKIGAQAFMNCTNLEGILINSEDTITIGDKSVDGCSKLRYMASNAYTGVMENGYIPNVTDGYSFSTFYIPTYSDGYSDGALSFTEDSGVFGYAVSDNNILYGLDMTMSPWLLLRAGNASGTVNIEPDTLEIWAYAFADLEDEFTIPFDSLNPYYSTLYIDTGAFRNSGITSVNTVSGAMIGKDAFYECSELKEFTVNGDTDIGENAFILCSSLEKVNVGKLTEGSLIPNMFYGCNNLKELYLNGYYDYYEQAPSLMVMPGQDFQFNMAWDSDEELQNLRIYFDEYTNIDDVIDKWKYAFIGYYNLEDSAYITLWDDTQFKLSDFETGVFPTDEEVDAVVKQRLLDSENRVRTLLGSEPAVEPVPYAIYNVKTTVLDAEENILLKSVTIRGLSASMDYVDLEDRMDLPVQDNLFYEFLITEGAFKNSPDMGAVYLPSSFTTLQDGFLSGIDSDSVSLWNISGPTPELEIKEEGVPYSFGIEDDKVYYSCFADQEGIFEEWKYALIGYSSQESFESAMKEQLKEEQTELKEGSDEFKKALEEKEDEKLEEARERFDKIVNSWDDPFGDEISDEGEVSE